MADFFYEARRPEALRVSNVEQAIGRMLRLALTQCKGGSFGEVVVLPIHDPRVANALCATLSGIAANTGVSQFVRIGNPQYDEEGGMNGLRFSSIATDPKAYPLRAALEVMNAYVGDANNFPSIRTSIPQTLHSSIVKGAQAQETDATRNP